MATMGSGIFGPIIGKAGTVVGSSWKGIPYIKARYKKRTGKVGAKEMANRQKFALAQSWLQPLLDFVRVGFKGYSPTVEGFNAAKSLLLKNSFERLSPDFYINPSLVKLSFGDLPLPEGIKVSEKESGWLEFSWDREPQDGANPKDQAMLVAYDINEGMASMTVNGQFRSVGADRLRIFPEKDTVYHLYAAFVAADRSRQSDSVYLGEWKMK